MLGGATGWDEATEKAEVPGTPEQEPLRKADLRSNHESHLHTSSVSGGLAWGWGHITQDEGVNREGEPGAGPRQSPMWSQTKEHETWQFQHNSIWWRQTNSNRKWTAWAWTHMLTCLERKGNAEVKGGREGMEEGGTG